MSNTNPAAIVRAAADVRILKNQFLAAAKAAAESNRKRLENYRIAGIHLIEIKNVVGHRNFGKWLKENCTYSDRQARRWMALAKTDTVSDLEAAWKEICGRAPEPDDDETKEDASSEESEEEEETDTEEGEEEGQEEESDEEETEPESPPIPERIKPHFEAVPLFKATHDKALRLGNILAKLEETPAYKAVHQGKHVVYSTTLRVIALNAENDTPIQPCPEGCGEVEPSPEADTCPKCGGKGYQTKDDIDNADS